MSDPSCTTIRVSLVEFGTKFTSIGLTYWSAKRQWQHHATLHNNGSVIVSGLLPELDPAGPCSVAKPLSTWPNQQRFSFQVCGEEVDRTRGWPEGSEQRPLSTKKKKRSGCTDWLVCFGVSQGQTQH